MNRIKRFFVDDQKKLMIFLAMSGLLIYNVVFFLYPLVYSLYGSFFDWNPLIKTMTPIGIANYTQLLSSTNFTKSMVNTLVFTFAIVLLRTSLGLVFAVMLNKIAKMQGIFRSVYFLPVVMPMVAVAIVWKWIYHPRIGLLNGILATFGIKGIGWLTNAATSLPAIVAMTVWKDLGYAIVIFIAALLNVSTEVYEAADIDGASEVSKFFHMTIPLVRPTTVFILITTLIGAFQSFVQIMIMTEGGPAGSSRVLGYLIFEEAFQNKKFGYASALSVVLFLLIIAVTLLQNKLLKGDD